MYIISTMNDICIIASGQTPQDDEVQLAGLRAAPAGGAPELNICCMYVCIYIYIYMNMYDYCIYIYICIVYIYIYIEREI